MRESPRYLLQFLTRSDNRVIVLAALTTGASFTRSELQSETGIPRSTVSRILGEFRDRGLVSRVGHRYEVTPFGGFLAERLHSVFDSIESMQRLQNAAETAFRHGSRRYIPASLENRDTDTDDIGSRSADPAICRSSPRRLARSSPRSKCHSCAVRREFPGR